MSLRKIRLDGQNFIEEPGRFGVIRKPLQRQLEFIINLCLEGDDRIKLFLRGRLWVKSQSLTIGINRCEKAILTAKLFRLSLPVFGEVPCQTSGPLMAALVSLSSMPLQQDFVAGCGINGDPMFPALHGRHIRLVFRAEVDLNFVESRHVALRALVTHGFRHTTLFRTIRRLMALSTRDRSRHCCVSWPMRIMACGAGQRVALLEALALQEIGRLVCDMVIFWMLCLQSLVVSIKWIARPITEGGAAVLDGVTVALSTQIKLSLAIQLTRMNDVVGGLNFGMRLMKRDVVFTRPVTHFTGDTKNEIVFSVLID